MSQNTDNIVNNKNTLKEKLIVIENFNELNTITEKTELCVIKTDFTKNQVNIVKKIKTEYPNTEFWLQSNEINKDNIIIANKIGINNVVQFPVEESALIDYFNKKNEIYHLQNNANNQYNYEYIKDSRIMIVDDNIMNIELLEEVLKPFNISISSFSKPKDAFRTALKEKFDLFLLDIMMPDMSGFEFAKRLKSSELNKDSAIIFISALSDSHNKIKGYDLGSFAYIEKPFDINIVKSQLYNFLKTNKEQQTVTSSKEIFLATVAHDLKTPINAEINVLKLLLGKNFGQLEDYQEEIIEDILHSTKFMKDMVENILCKNKMENDKLILSKEIYSLKEIVEHSINLTKYILKAKHQKIEFICENDNIQIPIDFTEIKRALHNLIANASEYSPEKGKIIIKLYQSKKDVIIEVQDFGNGIELADQKDVFSQYISYAKKYKKIGTGLGLYITKKIIEAHNGSISLNSTIGFGTTISVVLPKDSNKKHILSN